MSILPTLLERIERESIRLNHFYLGVEHLFLALVRLEDSLAARVLRQHKHSPEMICTRLEEMLGGNLDRHYWSGLRPTPRYQKVLEIATHYSQGEQIGERELLLAILDENDSIPIHLLQSLGLDMGSLSESIAHQTDDTPSYTPHLKIESSLPISDAERLLLENLFADQTLLKVEQEFMGGHDPSQLLLVRTDDTAALIRFDQPANIIHERRRLENHLTPDYLAAMYGTEAPLDFAITHQGTLGAIRYPVKVPLYDLSSYAEEHGWQAVSQILHENLVPLLKALHPIEGYHFPLWREYEMLLPSLGVLEAHQIGTGAPLSPLESRSIRIGTALRLQDFTIHRLMPYHGSIELSAGAGEEAVNHSSRIEVHNLSAEQIKQYRVGQGEREIRGIVVHNREEHLRELVQGLTPNFPVNAPQLLTPLGYLPNPLFTLPDLLDSEIDGLFGTIHGDLHQGNIFISADGQPYLANYHAMRFGHILFDWAMLEVSLWETTLPSTDDWEGIWEAAGFLQAINQGGSPDDVETIPPIIHTIITVREIAATQLVRHWGEYHAALFFIALGGLQRTTAPLGTQRWRFAAAALAAEAYEGNLIDTQQVDTTSDNT